MTKINRHGIRIHCDAARLQKEIIAWGEGAWWPKGSRMRFLRLTDGPVQKGTRYRQEVLLPFAPRWDAEVESMTDAGIRRRFLNGMFEGFETVGFAPALAGGFDVAYEMHYRVRGFLNRLFWPAAFEKMHDANIELILKNLKEYLERA